MENAKEREEIPKNEINEEKLDADEKEEKGLDLNIIEKFLKYRYITKITVFILSLLGLIQILVPGTILDGFLFFNPISIK